MFREPLIDERIIRRQQIDHIAILAHHAFKQQLRFAAHRIG